jgi:hypothetical protein
MAMLEVKQAQDALHTQDGVVKAVCGVSYSLERYENSVHRR